MKNLFGATILAMTVALSVLPGDAMAAKSKPQNPALTDANRKQYAEAARKACRQKFGAGATFQGFDIHKGKIIRVWCFP